MDSTLVGSSSLRLSSGKSMRCMQTARTRLTLAAIFFLAALVTSALAQNSTSSAEVDSIYPDAHALYLDLHQNPELSSHETQTAAKLADKLRSLGYDVTEHVGGTGIVALL